MHDTSLRWVLVAGKRHPVSDFAHLPPAGRPEAHCPLCHELVVLKLGTQRTYHAAHRSTSQCITHQPETAWHLNTKLHIAHQLAQSQPLSIQQPCQKCGRTRSVVWLTDWTDVQVEHRLTDGLQPDIGLYREEVLVAAIEVRVTHPITEEKIDSWFKQKVPWIEVRGQPELYEGKLAWTVERPLPIERHSPDFYPWLCTPCSRRMGQLPGRLAHLQGDGIHLLCYKLLDLYAPDGSWTRHLFCITCQVKAGHILAYYLEAEDLTHDQVTQVAKVQAAGSPEAALIHLFGQGKSWLQNCQARHSLLLSSPMPWVYELPHVDYPESRFPRTHQYDPIRRQWMPRATQRPIYWFDAEGREDTRYVMPW